MFHWSVRSSSDTIGFTVFMEDVNRKVAANFFLVIPPPEVAVHFSFLHELLPGYPSSGGGGPSRSPFHAHAHLSLPAASFFDAEFPFCFCIEFQNFRITSSPWCRPPPISHPSMVVAYRCSAVVHWTNLICIHLGMVLLGRDDHSGHRTSGQVRAALVDTIVFFDAVNFHFCF